MSTHPSMAELLQAVIDWLEQPPCEPAREAYLRLVARNALGIVQREMALAPDGDARAAARLEGLLGMAGPLPELEVALAARLRDGFVSPDDPALLAHLRQRSLDQLAIDQPRYRHGLSA